MDPAQSPKFSGAYVLGLLAGLAEKSAAHPNNGSWAGPVAEGKKRLQDTTRRSQSYVLPHQSGRAWKGEAEDSNPLNNNPLEGETPLTKSALQIPQLPPQVLAALAGIKQHASTAAQRTPPEALAALAGAGLGGGLGYMASDDRNKLQNTLLGGLGGAGAGWAAHRMTAQPAAGEDKAQAERSRSEAAAAAKAEANRTAQAQLDTMTPYNRASLETANKERATPGGWGGLIRNALQLTTGIDPAIHRQESRGAIPGPDGQLMFTGIPNKVTSVFDSGSRIVGGALKGDSSKYLSPGSVFKQLQEAAARNGSKATEAAKTTVPAGKAVVPYGVKPPALPGPAVAAEAAESAAKPGLWGKLMPRSVAQLAEDAKGLSALSKVRGTAGVALRSAPVAEQALQTAQDVREVYRRGAQDDIDKSKNHLERLRDGWTGTNAQVDKDNNIDMKDAGAGVNAVLANAARGMPTWRAAGRYVADLAGHGVGSISDNEHISDLQRRLTEQGAFRGKQLPQGYSIGAGDKGALTLVGPKGESVPAYGPAADALMKNWQPASGFNPTTAQESATSAVAKPVSDALHWSAHFDDAGPVEGIQRQLQQLNQSRNWRGVRLPDTADGTPDTAWRFDYKPDQGILVRGPDKLTFRYAGGAGENYAREHLKPFDPANPPSWWTSRPTPKPAPVAPQVPSHPALDSGTPDRARLAITDPLVSPATPPADEHPKYRAEWPR